VEFKVLGPVTVADGAESLPIGGPKQRAVLAMLIAYAGKPVSNDLLVEAVYGEDAADRGRRRVQTYVSTLRSVVGDVIVKSGDGWYLSVARDQIDALRFQDIYESVRDTASLDPDEVTSVLREALAMWRGYAYEDVEAHGLLDGEITRLSELRVSAQVARIDADLAAGRHADLIGEIEALLAEHPYQERFRYQHMLALYRAGRQKEALRSYQTMRNLLVEELGIDPSPDLQGLEQRILEQDPQLLEVEATGPHVPDTPASVMPLQRTSFVGRERELAQGAELLARSRLLTLTGPPGSGKTRLALRLASDHSREYPHGSFFVPLATLTDPRLVDSTIARALGLPEVPGETALESVKAFLRNRRTLLVLDNFEQIIPAAPQVGELLNAAPDLTVVVTARVPLGLSGEQEFPVPPLAVPPRDELPGPESSVGYDAVALFVARAQAVDPSFDLDRENAAAVSVITARLDGLPLAIELAAARIRLLKPQDLLSRLESRLSLLTGGPADVADRHRTMRSAIAWSYDLLEPEEQALFRRLGVFRGFTLEGVAAVADLPDPAVFDGMDSLLANSLVYRLDDVAEPRYAMLEMLREFALDQLFQAGERGDAARRHARFYRELAEAAEPELTGENEAAAVERLSLEVGNIRGALEFACDAPDADLGLVLAGCVWRFWQSSGQLTEGRDWLERLLALPGASDDARAKGLTALAGLAYWQADFSAAMVSYEEALALYRALEDRYNEADTLYSMSLTASLSGDIDGGERLARQARSIFAELGSKEGLGEVALAQAYVLWKRKDFSGALALYQEGVVIARELGDPVMAVTQLVGVAALSFLLGERDQALRIALDTLDEATELHNAHIAVWALDVVASFLAASAPDSAVRLAGAVDSLRREAGGGWLVGSLGLEDARSIAAGLLSASDVEAAWTEGRAMTFEEAVALAREFGDAGSKRDP
jgi:predicted ATPase/DNA-binding SARP family transcriptional activator